MDGRASRQAAITPRSSLGVVAPWRAVLLVLLTSGCALFGKNLPPGTAGGTFVESPEEPPIVSRQLKDEQVALDEAASAQVDAHFAILRELIASSTSLREQLMRSRDRLVASFRRDGRISSIDREIVLEQARWFLELDLLLYGLWTTYRRYLPYASEPDPYAPQRGASVLSPRTRVRGGLVALTSEVVRLDNARTVIDLLEDQLAVVHFLNRGDEARGIPPESFDRLLGAYRDPDRRALLKRHLLALSERHKELAVLAQQDGQVAFLLSLLEESQTARELRKERAIGRQLRFAGAVTWRSLAALLSPWLEIYVGQIVSDEPIEEEERLALAQLPAVPDQVFDALEPLDVLLVRDPTRSPLPHGYTHAVVYLGGYRRIRQLAVKGHPALAVHAGWLRRGRHFLDVTQQGPQLLDLEEVLSGQAVAVLRYGTKDPLGAEAVRRVRLDRALAALVSRRYLSPPPLSPDEHAARLLYDVYGHDLGAEPGMGRSFPALKDIVRRALEDSQVEIVLSSLEGEIVFGEKAVAATREVAFGPASDAGAKEAK